MAGYEVNPKRDGANFAGGRSRPKRVEEGIAGVMDLPILAGIGEAEYVWIPIFFKGLKAFSCRQGRGVWHTPYRRPGHGANDFVRYAPNGPFGIVRGAYAIRPYSLPAGGVFSYG